MEGFGPMLTFPGNPERVALQVKNGYLGNFTWSPAKSSRESAQAMSAGMSPAHSIFVGSIWSSVYPGMS
jgi:hypothetical protein